jgi:hypothetical protein
LLTACCLAWFYDDRRHFRYNVSSNQHKGALDNCMSNSSLSPSPGSSRATLKLKAGVRKAPPEPKATPAPTPRPQASPKLKPGARWSDEYKDRMQADMDALMSR